MAKEEIKDVEVKETKAKKAPAKKKAAPKKVEITNETKVRVFNNRTHEVAFSLASGQRVGLARPKQYKEVRVEDLDMLLGSAPSLLTKGSLYIDDKDVRDFLNIENYYRDGQVVHIDELEKLLSEDGAKLKESVKSLSNSLKDELFDIAMNKLDTLTVGKLTILEEQLGRQFRIN